MEEPLIYQPTQLSQHFSEWVREESFAYEQTLQGSFFTRVRLRGTLMMFQRHTFREIYDSLHKFVLPELVGNRQGKLQQLETLFKEVYRPLVLNNVVLAQRLQHEDLKVLAKTIEDERIEAFTSLAIDGEPACRIFKQRFGYYALNAYELAEPRFSEYDCDQLVALANPLKKLYFDQNKPMMSDYFASTKGVASITHLIGIRELGKSCALQVIAALRSEVEGIEKTGLLTKNVYEYDWDTLLSVV